MKQLIYSATIINHNLELCSALHELNKQPFNSHDEMVMANAEMISKFQGVAIEKVYKEVNEVPVIKDSDRPKPGTTEYTKDMIDFMRNRADSYGKAHKEGRQNYIYVDKY